jgi:hypothetical protein
MKTLGLTHLGRSKSQFEIFKGEYSQSCEVEKKLALPSNSISKVELILFAISCQKFLFAPRR